MTDISPEVEPTTEAPAVDTPAAEPEAPTYDWANADTQAEAAQALAHLKEWGTPDDVKRAMEVYKNFETDEGLSRVFVEAGRRFGIPLDKLEGLFQSEVAPAVEEEQPDPDQPLTRAEAMALMEKELEQRLAASQQTAAQQQRLATAQAATSAELAALGITDPAEVDQVLKAGQKHIKADDYDPEHIKEAVRKGHADFTTFIQMKAEAYLKMKREKEAAVPSTIGGATAGGDSLPEPQNTAEASKRVRARLREQG